MLRTKLRSPYSIGLNPIEQNNSQKEKQKILERVAKNGGAVFFEQDPKVDAARIKNDGADFSSDESIKLPSLFSYPGLGANTLLLQNAHKIEIPGF